MTRKLVTVALILAASPAAAADVTGAASAIDSDVIQIGDKRIMLFGMEFCRTQSSLPDRRQVLAVLARGREAT